MVGRLRLNPHTFQRQTDLAANILTFIIRRNIHIGRLIVRNMGRFSVVIQFKQVELQFGTKEEGIAVGSSIGDGLFQNASCIMDENLAALIGNRAEHSDDSAVLRPPGQYCNGCWVRTQKQVRVHFVAKALNGRSVNGNPVFKSALQFMGHD